MAAGPVDKKIKIGERTPQPCPVPYQEKDRLMAKKPVGSWRPAHRREAARLRELAAEATTDLVRRILEDQARAQDRLAGQAE